MAFERHRLPTLIGRAGTGRVIAAAAAIALTQFSLLAATSGVAQAAPSAPRTIPAVAALEEPARPWWSMGLHYLVLVVGVCFVAWMIHRFAKTWRADQTTGTPLPARRGFARGGFEGVLRAR